MNWTDHISFRLGPFDAGIPGPMGWNFKLDGDQIRSCEIETGLFSRSIEEQIESSSWGSMIPLVDRIDPEGSLAYELGACLSVEKLIQLEVPARAQTVRIILCEMTRVLAHLKFLTKVSEAIESKTVFHYVLREREKLLDLFEAVTGARFANNYFCFGGVLSDVTVGWLDRVESFCSSLKQRLHEYDHLILSNRVFYYLSRGLGVVSKEDAIRYGLTGPNARASGLWVDSRTEGLNPDYSHFDFKISTQEQMELNRGDTFDRVSIRFKEIRQSLEIILQAIQSIESGPFLNKESEGSLTIGSGEAYSRVESPRGLLGCYVRSDGGFSPERVQFRTPSMFHLLMIKKLLVGLDLEKVKLLVASFDLSVSEVDR